MTETGPGHLTPREIACGIVLGFPTGSRRKAREPTSAARNTRILSPLTALEHAVLPALRRPPCLVSFSGGLDSSLVLAVAVRAARREGLPDPVPVTWRFTGAPRAEESLWQERVVHALRLTSWHILTAGDDLDLVGLVARRMLHRYGQLHPPNRHLHLPIIEMAAGGSLLTGVGGDQILAGWRHPRPITHHLRRVPRMLRHGPALLKQLRHGPTALGRIPPGQVASEVFPWLRAGVSRELHQALRREQRGEPRRLDRRIDWHLRRRDLALTLASSAAIAVDHDVLLIQPLIDRAFTAALSIRFGHLTCPNRNALLAKIAADALPPVITTPRRKATFNEVFLRDATRDFVRSWDGVGADEDLVDVEALRACWSRWPIPPGTAALVQHLWLATHPAPHSPTPVPSTIEVQP